jgi:hypothetical protein
MKRMPAPFFGEFGDSLTFNSKDDTIPSAEQIAWRPDSLDFRRVKGYGERYILNLYLDWVFKKIPFAFDLPMKITHADGHGEPDFAVCENGRRYGLEITRATTSRDEASLDALIKAGPGYCLEMDADLNGEDRNYDLKADISPADEPFYGEPIIGVELELKWAKCTAYRISEKQQKLETNYLKYFPSCDLVWYSAASMHDRLVGIKLLQGEYASVRTAAPRKAQFKRIAIVCENWAIFNPLGSAPCIFTSHGFSFL